MTPQTHPRPGPWNLETRYLSRKRTFQMLGLPLLLLSHLRSCPTPCDPIDGSPPGSAIPGILQAIKDFKMRGFPGLFTWTQWNHKVPYSEWEAEWLEAERDLKMLLWWLWRWRRGHRPRSSGSLEEVEKVRKQSLTCCPQKEGSPASTLMLAQGCPVWPSNM